MSEKLVNKIHLAPLRNSVRLLVLMGTHTEVLNSLSRCPLAAEQNSI